jgi:5'-3' exonuclease
MVVLFDADSLVYSSCYRKKENETDDKFYTNIDEAIAKFDEVFMSIINHLEDIYEINEVKVFSDSRGNFRKFITPIYKANRNYNDLPPLLNEMHQYVKEQYNSIYGYGCETDDVVAKYWYELSNEIGRDNVIIVSIDKDYKQFPCLIYNYHYNHKCVYDISEKESLFNFYEQMIIGDTSDNVNYCKGYGKKYAQKYLAECKTKYEYTKKIYELFKQIHKGKARQRYIECWNLLKLKTE